jgi:hypothetical protein
MIVLVPMVVTAPVGMARAVVMIGIMLGMIVVILAVLMVVITMLMVMMSRVMMFMAVVVTAGRMVMSFPLRLEGAGHGGRHAALATDQFGERRVVFDVQSVAGDLDRGMAPSELPGRAKKPQRVFGPDLQKALRRRPHQDELPILEPQGIAVLQSGLHVEIELDLDAALALQVRLPATARPMVKEHGIDDAVLFDGGLADDGSGTAHGRPRNRWLATGSTLAGRGASGRP